MLANASTGTAPPAERTRVCFVGDTYFGDSLADDRLKARLLAKEVESGGYAGFGAELAPVLRDSALTIANLESGLASEDDGPSRLAPKKLVLKSDLSKTLEGLTKMGIHAVGLANDHGADFGPEQLPDTIAQIHRRGLRTLGAGADLAEASSALRHTVSVGQHSAEVAIVAGFDHSRRLEETCAWFASPTRPGINVIRPDQISTLREAVGRDVVIIAFVHWFESYHWRRAHQRQKAASFLAAGADAVIGQGGRMLSDLEWFEGRPVLYSLGNFIFNSAGEYRYRNRPPFSVIAAVHFEPRDGVLSRTLRIYPIISDNTLTDYIPRPVNEAEFERVWALLRAHRHDQGVFDANVTRGRDQSGLYLSLDLALRS